MHRKVALQRSIALFGLMVGFATVAVHPAHAIPAFARKYNLQCQSCHSVPPRLTPFGYAFQRAGYRLRADGPRSTNINQVGSFVAEMIAQNTAPASAGPRGFDLGEVSLQAGSAIGEKLAARAIYQLHPGGGAAASFDELWVQYNSAPTKRFFTVRAGQIPILSGFRQTGLAPLTLTSPFILGNLGALSGTSASGATLGSVALGDVEKGVEFTGTNNGLTGRLSWLNGIDETADGKTPLGGRRANDIVLQAEKLLDRRGSSISGFYYRGRQPVTTAAAAGPPAVAATAFNNQFSRAGLFVNHILYLKPGTGKIPALSAEILGGWMWGKDVVDATGTSGRSRGGLVEGDLYVQNRTAYIVRYDTSRNSDIPGDPLNMTTHAVTLGIAHLPNKSLRLGVDLQRQSNPNVTTLIGSVKFIY